LFPFLPIPPLFRYNFFIIYLFSLVSGFALLQIIEAIEVNVRKITLTNHRVIKRISFNKRGNKIITVLAIIMMILAFITVAWHVNSESIFRKRTYISEDIIYLSDFINSHFKKNIVIVFPDSGPNGWLLYTLVNSSRVLLAEPRFPDFPMSYELSKLYDKYPTSIGVFDFSQVPLEEKISIIRKYNVSVIIGLQNRYFNATLYLSYFSNAIVIKYQNYTILLLNDTVLISQY